MTHPELDAILVELGGLRRRWLARLTGWPETSDWVLRRAPVPDQVAEIATALRDCVRERLSPRRAA